MYEAIQEQLKACVDYVAEQGHLKPGAAVVLGCSTSEVAGGHIGKNSVPELGDALAEAMISACKARGLNPVFQCCEHLNRALVMEQKVHRRNQHFHQLHFCSPQILRSLPQHLWCKRAVHPCLYNCLSGYDPRERTWFPCGQISPKTLLSC